MEKGNGQDETVQQQTPGGAQPGEPPSPPTPSPEPPTDTGGGAPTGSGGGGGSQADQSGPRDRETPEEIPGTSRVPEPTSGVSAMPDKGDAPETAPVPEPTSGVSAMPDKGDAPETAPVPEDRREVLWQGEHDAGHQDGSVLHLDGQGGATFTDGQNTARLEGDTWVDARTGQPAGRGVAAKADHRLRSVEMDRGLRNSMKP